ncbi:Glutamate--cysteine ligase catalytic subunit-like protein, partial [Leptotrombidium deliense]
MGLLSLGKPLTWNEAKKYAEFVQNQGILQFIEIYRNAKERQAECLRWGDEIEYMIVKFDNDKEKVKLALKAKELLEILNDDKN